ncbi:hypothetical protein IGJ28_001107 [Enterococcus sp. AZ091]|uniref:hypothetical protein n=1 Tax=Enterococcus sp. AZ091 TaxID=2774720 RepID=UPI003F2438E8
MNHEIINQPTQYELSHSQVKAENQSNMKELEKKKKKAPKKKTVYDLDKEIEALKKRRETLLKKQVSELGEKVLEILERHGISFLEISAESELFYSELEEIVEQNKENLQAIVS